MKPRLSSYQRPKHTRRRRSDRRWICIALAVLLPLAWGAAAQAVEQADEFVGQLRERGLYDLAIDYLDRLEQSSLADDVLRAQIPYLRAVTQIDEARHSLDPDERSKLMDQARAGLEEFAAAHPDSVQGAEAQLQLATLLFEQGQQTIAQAGQLPKGPAYATDREGYYVQARGLLSEASGLFQQSAAFYQSEQTRLTENVDADEVAGALDQRQEVRGRLAQVSVLAAQALHEQGLTYPPSSSDFRQLQQQAAGELNRLYRQYSRWLVGFYARLHEGRCYQALGDYEKAIACYEEILAQPSVLPAFRTLIANAFRYQAECFLAEDKYDEAIQSCTSWLEDARGDEAESPEWLAVRLRLAEALEGKGKTLREGSADARRLLAESRDAYRLVANSPGEFQAQARNAAAALSRDDEARDEHVRTFQEAYQLGKEAMASVSAAKIAIPSAKRNNPSAVAELHAQMEQGKDDARRYLRLATTLVDDQTDLAALNDVRYYLCWLYWENGDYYRAAVLGEFMAKRYSDHSAASAAAKIAMASYERLYNQSLTAGAGQADTDFEARHMAEMAELLTRRWPGTEDANAAFSVLASYAIRSGHIDEAQRMLDRVPADYRPRLELQLGNAMWGQYLELARRGGASPADEAARNKLRSDAVKYLDSGFRSVRSSGKVDETAAMSALCLVQSMLEDGRYDEAIRLLDDRQVGPLALVSQGHAAAARPAYAVEAYKAALRAYVSVTPPQVDRAIDTIDSLEKVAQAGGGQTADQLTQTYIGLSMVLKQQIGELKDAGRDADAARMSRAFAELLGRIDARQADGSAAQRLWLAQTYYNMGKELGGDDARPFFVKARDAFRQLAAQADADPDALPSGQSILAVKKQLGDCLRELGQYEEALDTFSDILKEKENHLAVQVAAAQTYEARGETEDPRWFEQAIYGGYKLRSTGKNRIWGWLKIALVAERASQANPQYRDTFFEARLSAARCRYLAGVRRTGPARTQDLAKAKQSILSVLRLYPDLGGPAWRDRFDQLLKQIQSAAGDQPVGLSESAAATPSAGSRSQ
jgi:tetratricopeptide (TPR) repeat protein